MFKQPCLGVSNTSCGKIKPYAATTITSASTSRNICKASALLRNFSGCATRNPKSKAACLTGLACNCIPRPFGRSGCVKTSGISKPAAAIAFKAAAAKSGVPAKITFMLNPLFKGQAAFSIQQKQPAHYSSYY